MEKKATRDIFSIVTGIIIEKLEQGIVPWKQPWTSEGPPRNLITQRPYRGINHLLLGSLGYPRNEYLTFRQAQDIGAKVSKGEKAHLVVFWVWLDDKEVEAKDAEEGKVKKRPLLRYYHVFNAAQCEGIPEQRSPMPINSPIQNGEKVVEEMPNRPQIVHGQDKAYYHPTHDYVGMPDMARFLSSDAYYSTLFHELIHSTGHQSRLNRKELVEHGGFGSDNYSIEELTAEIGACYLTSHTGIDISYFSNSIAYIQGWLARLREDKKLILYASGHAQRAADYILNGNGIWDNSNVLKSVEP